MLAIALLVTVVDQWTKFLAVRYLTPGIADAHFAQSGEPRPDRDTRVRLLSELSLPASIGYFYGTVLEPCKPSTAYCPTVPFVDGFWNWRYVENPGAAWGLLTLIRALAAVLQVTHPIAFEAFSGILMFASGALVGSFLMGVYLLISLNVFGRHSNEAFSSLRIEDFKNFLRLHIAKDGSLTIFPIGIERVPRKWKPTGATSVFEPQLEPDDPKATAPHLIEPPVVVQKPRAAY